MFIQSSQPTSAHPNLVKDLNGILPALLLRQGIHRNDQELGIHGVALQGA